MNLGDAAVCDTLLPMRGIGVPEKTEDFTADPVELFFDLAYVFAFSQLVGFVAHHPGWSGVGEAALLFGLLWLPWQQLTWAANAVSGNGRAVRLLFLAATTACVPMAAATSSALGDGGLVFAAGLGVIMLLGFLTQGLSSDRGTALRSAVVRWIAPNAVALVVLFAGASVRGGARVALWCVSLVVVLGAMILAGRGEWLVRSGHFAERHGLIVIIALGEVIVAIGIPVVHSLEEGEGLPGRTVVALVAAGLFAALLWWAYFDRPGPALEHRAQPLGDRDRARYVRDVYTWAHAPIVAGIVLSAAALEQITLHPLDDVPASFRAMLLGGLALTVLGVESAIWRAFRVLPPERMTAVLVLGVVLFVSGSVAGVVLLLLVDVVIAATLTLEHLRVERRRA